MRDGLTTEIFARLDEIHDPCSAAAGTPMGLVEMGLVSGVAVAPDGDVRIDLRFTSPFCHMVAFFQEEAVRRVGALEEVGEVTVVGDQGLDWTPDLMTGRAAEQRRLRLEVLETRARRELDLDGGPAVRTER